MEEERLALLFHKIDQKVRRQYNRHLESVRLTAERWAIIRDLHVREKRFNQASSTAFIIASRLEEDPSKVETLLEKMVREDWLVAVQNPTDRRMISYFLSNKSQGLIPYLMEQDDYVESLFMKSFSEDEKENLKEMLKKIEMGIK